MTDRRPVPGNAFFKEAVLKALGQLTNHQPGALVSSKVVKARVIQILNLQPLIEEHGWPLEGRNWSKHPGDVKKPIGVNRRISLAYQKWNWKLSLPLTRNFGSTGKRGMWGLTEAGLAIAKNRNGHKDRNWTADWLEEHLKPGPGNSDSELMVMLRGYVSSKMGISAKAGLVEDHIQNWFMRAIRRDALQPLLSQGKKVTYKRICSYVLNSCKTDIRDAGTNPVARSLYGAKTDTDRKYEKQEKENPNLLSNPDKTAKVVTTYNDISGQADGFTIVEKRVTPEVESQYQSTLRALRKALVQRFPRKGAVYARVLMAMAEGKSSQEIADDNHLTPGTTKKLMVAARKAAQSVSSQFL